MVCFLLNYFFFTLTVRRLTCEMSAVNCNIVARQNTCTVFQWNGTIRPLEMVATESTDASRGDTETADRRKRFTSFLDQELNGLETDALATHLVNGPELCEAVHEYIATTLPNNRQSIKSNETVYSSKADGLSQFAKICAVTIICLMVSSPIAFLVDYVMGIRCILPNNYLIWEATRPISDCTYCNGITRPLILNNMTQEEFQVCCCSSHTISPVLPFSFYHRWNSFSRSPIRRDRSSLKMLFRIGQPNTNSILRIYGNCI